MATSILEEKFDSHKNFPRKVTTVVQLQFNPSIQITNYFADIKQNNNFSSLIKNPRNPFPREPLFTQPSYPYPIENKKWGWNGIFQENQEKEEMPRIQITNHFADIKHNNHFYLLKVETPDTHFQENHFSPNHHIHIPRSKKGMKWDFPRNTGKGSCGKDTRCRCRLLQRVEKQQRPLIWSMKEGRWICELGLRDRVEEIGFVKMVKWSGRGLQFQVKAKTQRTSTSVSVWKLEFLWPIHRFFSSWPRLSVKRESWWLSLVTHSYIFFNIFTISKKN